MNVENTHGKINRVECIHWHVCGAHKSKPVQWCPQAKLVDCYSFFFVGLGFKNSLYLEGAWKIVIVKIYRQMKKTKGFFSSFLFYLSLFGGNVVVVFCIDENGFKHRLTRLFDIQYMIFMILFVQVALKLMSSWCKTTQQRPIKKTSKTTTPPTFTCSLIIGFSLKTKYTFKKNEYCLALRHGFIVCNVIEYVFPLYVFFGFDSNLSNSHHEHCSCISWLYEVWLVESVCYVAPNRVSNLNTSGCLILFELYYELRMCGSHICQNMKTNISKRHPDTQLNVDSFKIEK